MHPNKKSHSHTRAIKFSLAEGGLLYRLYVKMHLVKPPLEFYKRRIAVVVALAWLPLLVLSVFNGDAFSGIRVPFLYDIDTHMRLLVALSILLAADVVVNERLNIIVGQFLERGIVAEQDKESFGWMISSAMRLCNSYMIEFGLLILAFTCGHWIWQQFMSLNVAAWYAIPIDGINQLTPAGYWYVIISLPLFQFIGLRWYFRLFVWYRFLWQVSRLPLRLNGLHPDKAAGLGFLSDSLFAFALVLIAHSVLLFGIIANRVKYAGASLMSFELEIVGLVLILMSLVVFPLTFFMVKLAKTKRFDKKKFGLLSCQYVNDFYRKWINSSKDAPDLLGTPDMQSLADLANSYNVVNEMSLVPFSRGVIVRLLILISLPLFPLVLLVLPLAEMISRLVRLLI